MQILAQAVGFGEWNNPKVLAFSMCQNLHAERSELASEPKKGFVVFFVFYGVGLC